MKNNNKKILADFFILPLWRIFDLFIPKKNNYYGFSVHHIKSDQFIENSRAMFEQVKNEPGIKKIIFVRSKEHDFFIEGANNYQIVNLKTLTGLYLLAQCKVLFLTHSISMDFSLRFGSNLFSVVKPVLSDRIIVNLWHGIPLKKLLSVTNTAVKKQTDRISFRRLERKFYTGLIASSAIDSYAMAAMFYPIKFENIWVTGLPRNDFLVKKMQDLPSYFRDSVNKIINLKNNKKLILYAPTYRQTMVVADSHYYQFSDEEMGLLKQLLVDNNAVLGFRMHYFRNSENVFNFEKYIDNTVFFDLGHEVVSDVAAVIRVSDLIITDYSSVYIDAMYINKPVLSFAYDLEHYNEKQDGILYDLDIVFPGSVVTEFDVLLNAIASELKKCEQVNTKVYRNAQKFFFTYRDDSNSKRVLKYVENALAEK